MRLVAMVCGGLALAACVLDWPAPPQEGAGGAAAGGSSASSGGTGGVGVVDCALCPDLVFDQAPVGNSIVVPAGGDLQGAVDRAEPGDEIVLDAGAVYMGGIVLPDKTGTDAITVRTADLASISRPCERLGVEHLAALPKIIGTGGAHAIVTDRGHDWRFVGVELGVENTNIDNTVVKLGSEGQADAMLLPRRILFDRVYVRGDADVGTLRGIWIHAEEVTVANSRLTDLYEPVQSNQDSHAIVIGNSPGNIAILNNQLESNDAPVTIGKYGSAIPNLVPTNIDVRLNHFTRPARWIRLGAPDYWHLRSLVSFFNAKQVTLEANVFDTVTFQYAFRLQPARANRPWAEVSDLVFRHNRIDAVVAGWEIFPTDPFDPGTTFTHGITVDNNLLTNVELDLFVLNGADTEPIVGLELRHNTALQGANIMSLDNLGNEAIFLDNVLTHGSYGVKCNAGPSGEACFNIAFASWEFDYNLVITDVPGEYPANMNEFVMVDPGFVDRGAGNYRLMPSSPGSGAASDGKDMGVDFDAMQAAAACRTSPAP